MCTSPLYRLNSVYVPPVMRRRIYRGAVIMRRPEYLNFIKEYPHLSRLPVEIPCGQCIECRLNSAREWSLRCGLECQAHPFRSWFLTLTYDDAHIPLIEGLDPHTGDAGLIQNLSKRDCQLFFKRLRSDGFSFRYFLCGEYGETTFRPHYHALFFDCDFPDKKLYTVVSGTNFYRSAYLERFWQNGQVLFSYVFDEAVNYVCRYQMKKLKGRSNREYKDACSELGLDAQQEEFILASRRPAIGAPYVPKDFSGDVAFKGVERRCHYFDTILARQDPSRYLEVKSERRRINFCRKVGQTEEDRSELMKVAEEIASRKQERAKKFKV